MRALNRLDAMTYASGVLAPRRGATLEVIGRRSGQAVTLPVAVVELDGSRFLVSMLGRDSNWVRNVRAADGRAVLRRRGREPVVLDEIPVSERPPVLRRYLAIAPGARPHFPVDWQAPLSDFVPIADRYPVFRITGPRDEPSQSSSDRALSIVRPVSRGVASLTSAEPANSRQSTVVKVMGTTFDSALGDAYLVGRRHSPHVQDLRDFLGRNRVPFGWVDLDRDPLVRALGARVPDGLRLPVFVGADGSVTEWPGGDDDETQLQPRPRHNWPTASVCTRAPTKISTTS